MKSIFQPVKVYLATLSNAEAKQFAKAAGVNEYTVLKIKSGEIEDPGVTKVEKLAARIPRRRRARADPKKTAEA